MSVEDELIAVLETLEGVDTSLKYNTKDYVLDRVYDLRDAVLALELAIEETE